MAKFTILMASAALLSSASLAQAATDSSLSAIALSGDKTLHMIDASTAAVTGSMEVKGVDRLLGIDLRPATGQLIGVSDTFETSWLLPISTLMANRLRPRCSTSMRRSSH